MLFRSILSPLVQQKRRLLNKSFSITSGQEDQLLRSLRSQEIDLVLTNKPVYAEDVQELAAVEMPVRLIIANQSLRNYKIRISRNTKIEEFLTVSPLGLILPSNKMKLRHETDIFMQDIKTRKRVVMESDILSVVGRAVIDGAGIAFLPVPYLYEEIKMGLVSTIGPKVGYWQHMLYLIARKESRYDEAIEEVRKNVIALGKGPQYG